MYIIFILQYQDKHLIQLTLQTCNKMSIWVYLYMHLLSHYQSKLRSVHTPLFSVFKPQWLWQWNAKEMRHVCSLAALSLSFSVSHSIALSFHCAWRSRFIDGTVGQAKQSYKRQTHEALQVLLVLHSTLLLLLFACSALCLHLMQKLKKKPNWRGSNSSPAGQKQLELIALFNCILVLVSSSDACAVFASLVI